LTCLVFLLLGWTDASHRLIALSVAAVVCIASSNGGTTSQDLKTGFLVGATPKYQQLSILVGAVSSALVIGVILLVLNQAGTIYSTKNLPRPAMPLDLVYLQEHAKQEKAPDDKTMYYVWHAVEGNPERMPPGKYLVDDQGQIRYLVDPGINGKLTRRDDGTEVMKFHPPQAEMFAMITDGILNQRLPWVLVLLGMSIAIVMELCGVSSLPFAVGVYLPLSTSAPIFVGGLVRFIVEKFTRKKDAKQASELESEMSSGVLFSTGYIAGGTLAGVIIAFFTFSDRLTQGLSVWQYRQMPVTVAATFSEQCYELAKKELGEKASDKDLNRYAAEIFELNPQLLRRYAPLPAGMMLILPGDKTEQVKENTTLGEFAKAVLGSEDQAASLFELNADRLRLPMGLPVGVELTIPQENTPAVIAFAVLAIILMIVGFGWIFKSTPVVEKITK
jgi:hypothetical protein